MCSNCEKDYCSKKWMNTDCTNDYQMYRYSFISVLLTSYFLKLMVSLASRQALWYHTCDVC